MVNRVASRLMLEGKYVFSPISHTHPIAEEGSLPRGWDYWEGYDRRILVTCDKIIVLKLPGWEESIGVQSEIKIAKEYDMTIEYMDCDIEEWKKVLEEF